MQAVHSRTGASYSLYRLWSCQLDLTDLQRALRLSQQQRTEIVQLRRLFLSKMNGIAQQRQEIHQSLAVRLVPSAALLSSDGSPPCHRSVTSLLF